MKSETVLGIDFGTTNSVCAVLSGGDPEILENAEGNRVTPSVVYYTQDKEQNRPLVGESAQNKAQEHPERVISSVKRKMGDEEFIEVDGNEHRVEEVAADIIRKLRTDAAAKLGVDRSELTSAVVTTPAYWESDRNQAVMQAAELAGFESVRTIKEPASAAIAYGRFEPGLEKTVGVYDLGGGTFDFALVDVDVGQNKGEGEEYDVITQSGDPRLGGDDWDQRIVEWLAENFEKETGVNPLEPHHSDDSPIDHQIRAERIRAKAREAKESLSNRSSTEVPIRIPFLMEIGGESMDLNASLTETQFELLTDDLLEQTKDPMFTALDDAGMRAEHVDEVILIGGSTRMPQVKELVKSVFQQEPKRRVNPDEAVAGGAAIKGNREDILLLEVTPLSLGMGISGDRFKRMINRNERVPARATEVFTTSNEGATAVRIPIYQGERDIASENRHLKTLIIEGMTPGSRNSAHIEVTFEVQQNGTINVEAVESTRNKSVSVEIEDENQLPDDYVHDKLEEAREMEEMDRRRKKVIEAQNEAKKAIAEGERLLDEFPHVFEEDEDEHLKKHIVNVRQVRQDNTATLGELRDATEQLNEWVLEVGDRIRRTGARQNAGPKAGPDTDPTAVDVGTEANGTETEKPGDVILSGDETLDDSSDSPVDDSPSTPEPGPAVDGTLETSASTSSESNDGTTDESVETDTEPDVESDDEERDDGTMVTGEIGVEDETETDPSDGIVTPDVSDEGGSSMRGEEPESSPGDRMEMAGMDSDTSDSAEEFDSAWGDMDGDEGEEEDVIGVADSDVEVDDDTGTSSSQSDVVDDANDDSDIEHQGAAETVRRQGESEEETESQAVLGDSEEPMQESGEEPSPSSEETVLPDTVEDESDGDSDSESEDSSEDTDPADDTDEITSGESGEQVGLDDVEY